MIALLAVLLMISSCTALYAAGQLYKKELKYICALFLAPIAALLFHSWWPLLAWLTYFIACEFGYGDNNPLTKLLGKRGAITFCGVAFGLASFPVLHWLALPQALISGAGWWYIAELDDTDKLKEPWIAICRPLIGLVLYLTILIKILAF